MFRPCGPYPRYDSPADVPVPARLLTTGLACFLASLIGCEVVRRVALRRAMFDEVNERSLHTVPTPRLGGVAIVIVALTASILAWHSGTPEVHVLVAVCGAIGLVGLRDDVRPMSAAVRIAIQIAVSLAFLQLVGTPAFLVARGLPLPVPTSAVTALLVVWMVAVLNIYNFMDGMDGLAAFQTVTASAALAVMFSGSSSLSYFALVLGASAFGFLVHNFPPARIFMGDAGSTFIGMSFAALAVLGMHHEVPITESALPLAPFLLDGTFTIVRRALRKEKIWKAHRTHLYQRAVQSGVGHRQVLLVYVAWLSVSAGGAVLASQGTAALGLAWIAAALALVLVWRWVVARESAQSGK
jgi:UDP-N-acetylmuramyl pentapeptide phosphotransferase/UDP-N-acetylglucosamine-1-phosphate transferase